MSFIHFNLFIKIFINMINLKTKHFEIVQNILNTFSFDVYVFGSRAKKSCREFSDLDLCVFGNPYKKQIWDLKDAFEESRLPFTVDVLVWNQISKDFQDLIKDDLIKFPVIKS